MNAVVKITNLQYLQLLQQLLFSKVDLKGEKIAIVKLSFYNFMQLTITILTQYAHAKNNSDSIHQHILNHFMLRQDSPFNVYRHMFGFISMWKKYVECHEDARVLLSLLSAERSSKKSIRLFLKIRKSILRDINSNKIMQEILLTHQDIIAVSYAIFSPEMKSYAAKKIHELFINLKKKTLYSNNKINGAVVCQFFMNCAEKFESQELQNIKQYYENASAEEKDVEKEIIRKRTFSPLDPHQNQQQINRNLQIEPEIAFEQVITSEPAFPKKNLILSLNPNKQRNCSPDRQQNRLSAQHIVNTKYSYSWQKFLKTNQEMKERLLKNHQQNV